MLASRREVLKYGTVGLVLTADAGGLVTLTACNGTQWISVVLADLPTALQAVGAILTLFGKGNIPPALIQQVQTDLQLVQTLVNQYKANPGDSILSDIDKALLDAQTNLQAILQAVHIYDPAIIAAVSAAVGAAIIVVTSIQALIPAPTTATAARQALGQPKNGSVVIRTSFDEIFLATGYKELAF